MSLTVTELTVQDRLTSVSLTAAPGSRTIVLGPNGAGKSTLLRVLAGLVSRDTGSITVDATPLDAMTRRDRAAAIAWLPQTAREHEPITARDLVAAARYRFEEPWRVARERAEESLISVGADAWADRPVTTLSGGEAQRVRLAALVAQQARWWLLDEPFAHLDPAVRLELSERILESPAGILWVTHDLDTLARIETGQVMLLRAGRARVLDRDDPDLDRALGATLGLKIRRTVVEGREHVLVVGRA